MAYLRHCQEKNGVFMPEKSVDNEKTVFAQQLQKVINEKAKGKVATFCTKESKLNRSSVRQWLKGKAIPKKDNLQKLLKHTGKTEEFFFPEQKAYQHPPEHIGIPKTSGRDSRPQLYTEPTAGKFKPKLLYGPPDPNQAYIDAVKEIFDSEERGTIEALKSNITQFQEQVRDKKLLKELQNQVKLLTNQHDTEKNP